MEPSRGFPPVARSDAIVLVLGSLPSSRSIAEQQYYAHPRNAFWPIMKSILGVDGSYEERCGQLIEHRIALWDVLASSVRPGSMDADIDVPSAQSNDLGTFLDAHRDLRLIAFNGSKAQELFGRCISMQLAADRLKQVRLPSTSPAYAAMPFSAKLGAWRQAIESVLTTIEGES